MSKNILLLGGTSASGIQVAKEALKRGHKLTLYVRNPSKIPEDIKRNENVRVVEGQLDEASLPAIESAVQGNEVVISLLGPIIGTKTSGHLFSDFYRLLLPLLKKHNCTRAFICCTPSHAAPEDGFNFVRTVGVFGIKTIAGYAYQEVNNTGALFSEGSPEVEGIKWTLFRVFYLSDGEKKEVFAGYIGDGKWGAEIERSGIARWVIGQAETGGEEWVGKKPALYSSGTRKD